MDLGTGQNQDKSAKNMFSEKAKGVDLGFLSYKANFTVNTSFLPIDTWWALGIGIFEGGLLGALMSAVEVQHCLGLGSGASAGGGGTLEIR